MAAGERAQAMKARGRKRRLYASHAYQLFVVWLNAHVRRVNSGVKAARPQRTRQQVIDAYRMKPESER